MESPEGSDRTDLTLLRALAHGDASAFEPLMERWGDPVLDTCFRALHDTERACELYVEVWAEVYVRMRYGAARIPDALETWIVGIIGELVEQAASTGRIPTSSRNRMRIAPSHPSELEIQEINRLDNPSDLREVREALPREFSAAADLMLLRMPGPNTLSKVRSNRGGTP